MKNEKKCMKNENHFFEKRFHARHVEVHFFNVEVRHEVFILFFVLRSLRKIINSNLDKSHYFPFFYRNDFNIFKTILTSC